MLSSSIRFTGITLSKVERGSLRGKGLLLFYGPTDNLPHRSHPRQWEHLQVDPVHMQAGSTAPFSAWQITTSTTVTAGTLTQGFIASNTYGDSIGWGDGTWTNATPFGTSHNFFIESSIFNSTAGEDCDLAGAFVFRYSSILNGPTASSNIHNHGTKLNIPAVAVALMRRITTTCTTPQRPSTLP